MKPTTENDSTSIELTDGDGDSIRFSRELAERLAQKCDIGDCWEWTRGKNNGYGRARIDGKLKLVHRAMYEALVGPIPEGLQIDHLCRNRACVNPDHLEPVTPAENTRRGQGREVGGKRQRDKTHCPKGHEYSGDNLYIHPAGGRFCRACNRLQKARRRAVALNKGTQ